MKVEGRRSLPEEQATPSKSRPTSENVPVVWSALPALPGGYVSADGEHRIKGRGG